MSDSTHPFGWLPPEERTAEQQDNHERILSEMPRFSLPSYSLPTGRFALWQFCQQVNGGRHVAYAHQTTGSCVGAGLSQAVRTLARVEIAHGDPEFWPAAELWWPWTYGQSRLRGGLNGRGEGSFGSAAAEAAHKDGFFSRDEVQGLPEFADDGDGWLQLPRAVELEWSDGRKMRDRYKDIAKKHLVELPVPIKSADEAKAAIVNGYPITMASMFGTRTIRESHNVNVAEWDDEWAHQMFVDEAWDHPSLGLIFRVGNNWGPRAHPAPTQGEPPGGFYLLGATMDRICKSRGGEVYAFFGYQGFRRRDEFWMV